MLRLLCVTMNFQPQINVTSIISQGRPYTEFETLGSFVFRYACCGQIIRTEKQTDSKNLLVVDRQSGREWETNVTNSREQT